MKNQEKVKNSRWYRLGFDNENIPQKSIHSKDSSVHSKYTPTKNLLKSPETRLNIPALKDKVVPVQQLRKQNESRNFSDVEQKSELMDYKNKETSINRGICANNLNTSVISLKGNNHLSNHEICKNNHQDDRNQSASNRKSNVGILLHNNYQNRTPITQYQKQTNANTHKSVEQMHEYFLLALNSMEKDLNNERINIIKMLDEKQRVFVHTKQKIMSALGNKHRQMKRQEPKKIIPEDYSSREEQKYTLARVTSQKIFTRAQKQKQKQKNMCHKNEGSRKSMQKSQCVRSSGSKAKSEYRSNFDVIFDTINQMKSELEVIGSIDGVPPQLEYVTTFNEQKYRTTNAYKQNENKRRNFMLEMPPIYTKQFGIQQGKFNTKKHDPYNI